MAKKKKKNKRIEIVNVLIVFNFLFVFLVMSLISGFGIIELADSQKKSDPIVVKVVEEKSVVRDVEESSACDLSENSETPVYEVVFSEKDKNFLNSVYLDYYPLESAVCLYGELIDNFMVVQELEEAEVISTSKKSISFNSCKSFDSFNRTLLAVFHSHTNGFCAPSVTDSCAAERWDYKVGVVGCGDEYGIKEFVTFNSKGHVLEREAFAR